MKAKKPGAKRRPSWKVSHHRKEDLARRLMRGNEHRIVNTAEAKKVVDRFVEMIREDILAGKGFHIRGVGTIVVRSQKSYKRVVPTERRGREVADRMVPERIYARFRTARVLKRDLNEHLSAKNVVAALLAVADVVPGAGEDLAGFPSEEEVEGWMLVDRASVLRWVRALKNEEERDVPAVLSLRVEKLRRKRR